MLMGHSGAQPAAVKLPWYEQRPALVLCLCAVALATLIGPYWYATPDAAAYLSLARRVAHGAPAHAFGSPQPSFPLGYPLLIAPVFWFGDRPFLLISCMHWLLAVSFMLGVYGWLRRVTPEAAVLLTVGIMANVNIWNLYRRTLSEVAFLPLLIWAINLCNHALDDPDGRRGTRLVMLATVLIALVATRETGLLAVGAVVLTAALAHRRNVARPLFAIAAGAVSVGAALLLRPERLTAVANAMRAAFDSPAGVAGLILDMARRRVIQLNQLTTPGMFNAYSDPPGWLDANLLAGAIVLVLAAVGWTRLFRRQRDTYLVFGPLYLGALVWWPYDGGARYLLPLGPLIAASAWEALSALRWRRVFTELVFVGHLVFTLGYWLRVDLPRGRECNAEWPAVEKLAQSTMITPATIAGLKLPSCVELELRLAIDQRATP